MIAGSGSVLVHEGTLPLPGPRRQYQARNFAGPGSALAGARRRGSIGAAMPELPDVVVYIECLERRIVGTKLEQVRIVSPFVLRSADPPIGSAVGKTVREIRRMGKRIVFVLEDDLFLVLHLMIAGRLAWAERGAKIPGKIGLAALDFATGTLIFREASTKKRASMHLVRGEEALRQFDRGGLEVLSASLADFRAVLARENHTIKVALVDPTLFSGIGNAYSDEILHRARLSPVKLT